jgi:prepilin-type N-terminal cleavage/methylation domain-containing protein
MRSQRRTPHTTPAGASHEAGFTLVESLVAIVIMCFGLIAVTNLMIVAASSNTVANQATAAATIASQRLEILKQTPFGTAPFDAGTVGSVTSDSAGFNSDDAISGVGTIHTRWLVTRINSQAYFITVRSEGRGALTGARSRAEFTTFRSCTAVGLGCPPPGA